jgi:two-component system chemotaxis sensor kinase CheA
MQKAEKLEQIANNIFQMSLRTTTEKSPHFSVSVTQDFSIDRVVVEKLSQVLPILFSNSFEHAFKSPLLNREPEISLSLASPTDNRIELIYSDNGPGIDVKKLRSRALQLRPEMVELLSAWSDEEALQLIFLDQFSMAAELTPAAGRGVGLSVVKSELDKVGGRVRVSQDENGLHFLIQCPQWSAL